MREYQTTLTAAMSASQEVMCVAALTGLPVFPFRVMLGTEILEVTGLSGEMLLVTRGMEGTLATAHGLGALVQRRLAPDPLNTLWGSTVGNLIRDVHVVLRSILNAISRPLWVDPTTSRGKVDAVVASGVLTTVTTVTTVTTLTTAATLTNLGTANVTGTYIDRVAWAQAVRPRIS